MGRPLVLAGIKKTSEPAPRRKDGANVAALIDVAGQATVGKVIFTGLPAMFKADDMVNLTTENQVVLMDMAIFTRECCPLRHEQTQLVRNGTAHAAAWRS